jgi:NAD(P)-dependent dehydrogenase (short-subunit alcohol dehydrogenase family)
MDFTNRNVVITGGSTGIGLATAKAFINAGASVLITGTNADSLQKAMAAIDSPNLKTLVSDTSDLKDIAELEQAVAASGKLDVLYLNAGFGKFAPIEFTSEGDFDAQFNVNVKGLFFTLQKLIPHLAEGASVITTSSNAASFTMANGSVYSATKAAVSTITRIAANELANRKIRVNIVSPGAIETNWMEKSGFSPEQKEAFKHQISAGTALKRIGNSDEIAKTVLFLASDAASFITGTEILVDGGMLNLATSLQ